jgi:enoyl-CoA hydratase/carnithine racemase
MPSLKFSNSSPSPQTAKLKEQPKISNILLFITTNVRIKGFTSLLLFSTLIACEAPRSTSQLASLDQDGERTLSSSTTVSTGIDPRAPLPEDPNVPTVLVEKRNHIYLIGINRPEHKNRIDPATYEGLARAYYKLEADPDLRVGVLYGIGDDFCMGLDVSAWAPVFAAGPIKESPKTLNPLGQSRPRRTKPVVIAVHGGTKFMGHEFFLASDIRVAAEDTRFSQAENAYAVFPGGGATINFVREAGWGQAMYHMLLADEWGVDEAMRMRLLQIVVPKGQELAKAIEIAERISRNAPLAVQATISTATTALTEGPEVAFSKLMQTQNQLLHTADFQERVRASREGRAAVYSGQ